VAAISAEAANYPIIGRPVYELTDFQLMRAQRDVRRFPCNGLVSMLRTTVVPCAGSTGTAMARSMC
jgi:hypothetical protein